MNIHEAIKVVAENGCTGVDCVNCVLYNEYDSQGTNDLCEALRSLIK